MMCSLDFLVLQQYWWLIISVLAGFLVFLLFVQGGQSMIFSFSKDETVKQMIVNTLGRKWEFTFTTLVTFGGAFFASFPLFYSTSFGGAYWAWIALLFCFIVQAVSYEYRSRPNNFLGKKTFDVFLLINGIGATVLIGTVVGTFFNGANFQIDLLNRSEWLSPFHGLEAVANWHNVTLGLAVLFLSRVLALQYFIFSIDSEKVETIARKKFPLNIALFLLFFLAFLIRLMFMDGFEYNSEHGTISIVEYKYFSNLIEMPIVAAIMLIGVVAVLFGMFKTIMRSKIGFVFTGAGAFLAVVTLFLIAGYNNTCYYPSIADLQSSLHIENSSSSEFTLTTMSYVSILIPFVLAYIVFVWRAINRKKITAEEVNDRNSDQHIY